MKQKVLLLTLALALSIGQNNGQTAATLLATTIAPSGGTITAAGSYYLGFAVTGNIIIDASHVILDLNGHSVTGEITVSGRSHVTIMNGSVAAPQGAAANISLNECNHAQLSNLTLTVNESSGIICTASENISIKDSIVNNLATTGSDNSGILLRGSSKAEISDCTINNNGATAFEFGSLDIGINIQGNTRNVLIERCSVIGTNRRAYSITENSRVVTISECFSNSADEGFVINFAGNAIRLFRCIATGGGNSGFIIGDGQFSGVYLEECVAHTNAGQGFDVTIADTPCLGFHLIERCVALNNLTDGLAVTGCDPEQAACIGNFSDSNILDDYVPSSALPINQIPGNIFAALCVPGIFECRQRLRQSHYWRNAIRPKRGNVDQGGISLFVCSPVI